MNNNYYLLISIFLFSSISLFGQDTLIADEDEPEAEFSVAINPLDTNNIILSTMVGFGASLTGDLGIYYTYDGGDTWELSDFTGLLEGHQGAGDPVLAFDKEGNALLVNLVITDNLSMVNTILSKTTDGGATWELVSEVATGFTDKPWIAIDNSASSPFIDNVYIPIISDETNLYSLNNNYETVNIQEIPDGEALPSIVLGKDGSIFTSTLGLGEENQIFVQYYTEAGAHLEYSTEVVSFPDYTFNAPTISSRFQPSQYLAMDNSGGIYDGRLYLAYTASEQLNQNFFNIFLTYSDDKGESWSTPTIVHNDNLDNVQQFYSSIYVNNQGIVLIDWYDQRNYEASSRLTDFYLGISYDGGDSFTDIQLNSLASDFNDVVTSSDNFGIGDYHQMTATDHTAISFWSDGRTNDGDLNIYMAKVPLNEGVVSVEEISVISEKITVSPLYPQPVGDNVNIDFTTREQMKLKCELINSEGVAVWSSASTNYGQGNHSIRVPCNVISGSYYVKLSTDKGYFKSFKIIKP